MQMRIKFFLFFLLLSLNHSYDNIFSKNESLISMIQNIQKETSIFSDNTLQQMRAFDLTTGSTDGTVTTLIISSTGFNTINAQSCDWHPSGKWLACIGSPPIAGAIYDVSVSGTILYHINPQNAINHGGILYSSRWHPSGNYLAYAGNTASGIQGKVVFFDTETGYKSLLSSSADIILGANVQTIEWSPNGKYLAVGGFGTLNSDHVKTFSFDGYTLWSLPKSTITYDPNPTGNVETLHWHPSGKYLAIAGTSASGTDISAQLYYFNEESKSMYLLPGCNAIFGAKVNNLHWHPSGNFLAMSGDRNNNINIRTYSFNGQSLTEASSIHSGSLALNILVDECKWSKDGAYLAIGEIPSVAVPGDAQFLRIFSFLENKLKEITSYDHIDDIRGIAWSPDGRFISICGDPSDGNTVTLRLLQFTEPISLILKKQKKEILLLKKMFSCNSNKISILYDTVINTSNLLQSTVAQNLSKTLLVESSNASLSLGADPNATLVVNNSYALISLNTLNVANSNTLVTMQALNVSTSNALSGLLVRTSQAANALLIPNSQAIVTINNLASANSSAIITTNNLTIATSNAFVTYQPLIIANSQAISGLLVDTSNGTAGLLVATSQAASATAIKAARLDTIDTGPSNIHFSAASITMTYNLLLSTDHQLFVHASGVVNGNGHSITFARGAGTQLTVDPSITTTFQNVIFKDYNEQATSLGAGASLIFGNNCRVEISEPQTLLRTWSFAGISQLNGLGNALTLGTGPRFLSTLISSSLQLSNLKLLNVRENNIRAAHNNAAILYQDVVLNMSADFTYSVGSMLIQNDLILSGTSTFNYTTIMGLTVASASQLTIDQGTTFSYAPQSNFRDLLSLTDSSATLFFNHAHLVTTLTGCRLTKGTLLIDGILQIRTPAIAQSQAIVFGDGIPANDLTVKLYPGAEILLSSGYLYYANAN